MCFEVARFNGEIYRKILLCCNDKIFIIDGINHAEDALSRNARS